MSLVELPSGVHPDTVLHELKPQFHRLRLTDYEGEDTHGS
jgi:hypothetical protein